MDLDVIVVTYFTPPELLERCLRCLEDAAVAAAADVRVLIVNNGGSVAVSEAQVPNLHLTYHEVGENIGFGAAVNCGVRATESPRVLMLNPDTEVGAASLRVLIELLDLHEAPVLISALLTSRTGAIHLADYAMWRFSFARPFVLPRQARQMRERLDADSAPPALPVPKVPGTALIGRRADLVNLGPFDDDLFLYGEDRELSMRARDQGVELVVAGGARVFHARESSAAAFSELVHRARVDSSLRILLKHHGSAGRVFGWLDLLMVTVIQQAANRGRLSPACRARYRELKRWANPRVKPSRFDPTRLH